MMSSGKKRNQNEKIKRKKKNSNLSNDDPRRRTTSNHQKWKLYFSGLCTIRNIKMILLPPPTETALFLFCIVLVGSVICELNVMPETLFSNTKNPFNQIFVKWGWGWTLCLLAPYLVVAGILTCNKKWHLILKDCLRLVVGTFFWYAWVQLFLEIEHVTGACNVDGFPTKKSCVSAGFHWNGFDISGHTFILIHSLLTILEELQLMHEIFVYRSRNEHEWVNFILPIIKPLIYTFWILLLMLCYLWILMLFSTAVYFHTFSHKIIAAPIAIGTWLFTYRFWYQKPCSPGPVRKLPYSRE